MLNAYFIYPKLPCIHRPVFSRLSIPFPILCVYFWSVTHILGALAFITYVLIAGRVSLFPQPMFLFKSCLIMHIFSSRWICELSWQVSFKDVPCPNKTYSTFHLQSNTNNDEDDGILSATTQIRRASSSCLWNACGGVKWSWYTLNSQEKNHVQGNLSEKRHEETIAVEGGWWNE